MSGSANKHARLSPSASDRWSTCTASPAYIERLRDAGKLPRYEGSNIFGLAGTYAHDLVEELLLHRLGREESKRIKNFKNEDAWAQQLNLRENVTVWLDQRDETYPADTYKEAIKFMVGMDYTGVIDYVDYCMSQIRSDKDRVYVEVRSELFYDDDPEQKGTCDFLVCHDDGDITVVDLKWRRSGMVKSYQNTQLSIYAYSFISENIAAGIGSKFKDSTKVSVTTYNPLVAPHFDPWETTIKDLRTLCDQFTDAADTIFDGTNTMFVPSEAACKWCPAREVCKVKGHKAAMAIPDNGNVDTLSDEQAVLFYQGWAELVQLKDSVESRLTTAAEHGTPVEGTKLVRSVAKRRYKDEASAQVFLEELLPTEVVMAPAKLKSFGGIITALKKSGKKDKAKEFEDEHLIKPEGKMKLALTSDDKPAITKIKDSLFRR